MRAKMKLLASDVTLGLAFTHFDFDGDARSGPVRYRATDCKQHTWGNSSGPGSRLSRSSATVPVVLASPPDR